MPNPYMVILYISGFIFIGLVKIGKDPGLERELGILLTQNSIFIFLVVRLGIVGFSMNIRDTDKNRGEKSVRYFIQKNSTDKENIKK